MLKSYDYLNLSNYSEFNLGFNKSRLFPTKFYNTSMIQIDDNNYLYLVRYSYIDILDPKKTEQQIIPGNDKGCKPLYSSRDDNYFWWNNWNKSTGGTIIIKYNNIDKRFIEIQLENPGLLNGYMNKQFSNGFLLAYGDVRIFKINDNIYIYKYDLSQFVICEFDNNTNILKLLKSINFKHSNGKNFAPFKLIELDIPNESDKLVNLFYLDGFYGTHVLIKQVSEIDLPPQNNSYISALIKEIKISFNPDKYGFFIEGSYLTDKEEDIIKYQSFYGRTPGFSFTTPHIEIIENGKRCWIGVGHTKIRNPSERYPYIPGSKVDMFRHNLHAQMFEKYGDKYKLHMGTGDAPDCFGYIYLMYFYKLIDNGDDDYDMFISDSYLPLNLDNKYNENYKFSLVFPMGIIKQNIEGRDIIKVSCGEGDYYSIVLDFDFLDVMRSINKNIKTFDIVTYDYNLLLFKNGISIQTTLERDPLSPLSPLSQAEERLNKKILDEESKFNIKYLKYKSKYLKLKNNIV